MVIENTYPNLSNIVQTDFELDRVMQTVAAIDPGITVQCPPPFVALVLRSGVLTISCNMHRGVATTNTRAVRFEVVGAVGDLAFTAIKALLDYLASVATEWHPCAS